MKLVKREKAVQGATEKRYHNIGKAITKLEKPSQYWKSYRNIGKAITILEKIISLIATYFAFWGTNNILTKKH